VTSFRIIVCLFFLLTAVYNNEAVAESKEKTTDKAENLTSSNIGSTIGGEFTLRSISGPISLKQYKGNVVVLYFGYTHCPDVCPADLSNIAAAFRQLSDKKLKRVQGIFITLDPARDSVNKMAEYTAYFHQKIIGLTGTESEISQIASFYRVGYEKVQLPDSTLDYAINHSAALYLIDANGNVQYLIPHGTSALGIKQTIEYFLAKKTDKL
jgi:protein SCO1/2